MDRRSVCFSRSFSTTNAGCSKFLFPFPHFIIQLRNTPLLPPPPSSSSSSSSSSAALSAPSITRSQLQTLLRSTLFPAVHDVETLRNFAVAMGRAFHPEFQIAAIPHHPIGETEAAVRAVLRVLHAPADSRGGGSGRCDGTVETSWNSKRIDARERGGRRVESVFERGVGAGKRV